MKRIIYILAFLALLSVFSFAAEQPELKLSASGKTDKDIIIDLWPDEYLGEKGTSRGVLEPSKGDNIDRLKDVSIPSLAVYQAPLVTSPGPAVMVCPGGGYTILAMDLEGTEIADWLNSLGITAIVLKYRVPDNRQGAFEDAQRGMSIIRSRAKEFNIDPNRIGVIGFSAGGNLSARLSTNYTERSYKPVDPIDEVSCRPDFAMLVYPYLLTEDDKLQESLKVDSQTPPAILIHTQDDWVKPESSIYYFLNLKKAEVPAELHVFPTGGHGYGLRPTEHAVSSWPELCNTWLQKKKIITPESEEAQTLLIDDFGKDDGLSTLGTTWRGFTDQVMGGVSTGNHGFEVIDGKRCIRLKGQISLENNGGFVMISLDVGSGEELLDASEYKGLRITVCGNGQDYFVHLKTSQTPGHSQYYEAAFTAAHDWRNIEIPFDSFTGKNVTESIDTSQMRRIGIMGAWREFEADVALSRIELY